MSYPMVDAKELSRVWVVPESWVRSYSRERCPQDQRIPCVRFGRYVRYELGSPALEAWLAKHREGGQ
jgi:hypothetical protein